MMHAFSRLPKAVLIGGGVSLFLLVAAAIGLVSNRVAERTIPAILPGLDNTAFTLTAHRGGGNIAVSNRDLVGAPTALFFGFTHCPDVCPTTLTNLAGLAEQAGGGADMRIVLITVDPERDTPKVLAEYIDALAVPNAIGLSGSTDAVAKTIKGFGVYARKVPLDESGARASHHHNHKGDHGDYTMDHTATVFLYDRAGKIKGTIAWGEPTETALIKIKNLLEG